MPEMLTETVFTWGAPPVKFGPGAVDELAFDCEQLGLERVLVVTDPRIAEAGIAQRVADGLEAGSVKATVFDRARVEPTDRSFAEAVDFAKGSDWDGFIAVGGGSSIDTAKAINLMTTYPGEVMDYVNKPVGAGKGPPGPLKPLIAVPTTAGTGAESTPVCVLDILDLKVKTGISHPRLRPSMAVVDPLVTLTLPPGVTASAGMDVLCHALESYTARPYRAYPRKRPEQRVAYCGSNPISDAFTEKALGLLARSFRKAVMSGHDLQARSDMLLAASFAGMGFGNAGCHIPHACAYPIAGRVRDYRPADYPQDEPMVPHGQSVAVTAPAAFRFTYSTDADRHRHVAKLLDPGVAATARPAEQLPTAITALMRDIGIPNGIGALGFGEADIPDLVDGTLKQQRLLSIAPRDVHPEDLEVIFRESVSNW
ncbi:MAG: hydroxyacid-oxoacid transhydrogenase [Streptosporangiaceae bacterium]